MIAENLARIKAEIPEGVRLIAVSKFQPVEAIREAYEAWQRLFGESRVQEFERKILLLPSDIEWHFIGHLQTNKVKAIIGKTALIESVDTERLLYIIDEESRKAGVMTNVLMQLHVAREETKFGFSIEEMYDFFNGKRFENLTNTHICGLMGMATNTDDEIRIKEDFRLIYEVFSHIREDEALGLRGFDTVSMGMSGDWKIAVEEGSNMVRIGTSIFGERKI